MYVLWLTIKWILTVIFSFIFWYSSKQLEELMYLVHIIMIQKKTLNIYFLEEKKIHLF